MKFPKQYPNITSNLQKICSVETIGNSYVLRMINKDNRMNTRYVEAVAEALEDIETSYKLERKTEKVSRALITIGQEHIYSNGLDIQGELDSEQKIYGFLKELNFILAKFMKFPIPTVAALNGHAFAGGAVLAMAHDLRVMRSDRGYLCMNEIDIGIQLPSSLNLLFKNKTRDFQTYRDMVLQGHRFKAEEALDRGLVDSICPGDQVLDKALELAVKYGDKMVAGGDIYSPMRADYFKQVVCQMERESVKPKA